MNKSKTLIIKYTYIIKSKAQLTIIKIIKEHFLYVLLAWILFTRNGFSLSQPTLINKYYIQQFPESSFDSLTPAQRMTH